MKARLRTVVASGGAIAVIATAVAVPRTAWGQPSFASTQTGFGNGPEDCAVGALNSDGVADLACTNADGNSVSIFYGSATGFTNGQSPGRSLPPSGCGANPLKSPQGIALGDFNNDGTTDVAVSNYNGDNVSVFLRNADGSFQCAKNTATLNNPLGVAAGSLNADGNLDLAVATKTTRSGGYVSVLMGNGDGTFSRADLPGVDHPRRLIVGDFGSSATNATRDGKNDVAVTANGGGAVSVFFGNGTGAFSGATNYAVDQGPVGITTADYNHDGCNDIVTASDSGSVSKATILLGICSGAAGSFQGGQSIVTFNPKANTFGIATAFLHGDPNKPDLVVTNTGGTGTTNDSVAMLINHTADSSSTASFTEVLPECSAGDAPKAIVVGSFNSGTDSFDDWAVANRNSDTITVFSGDGSGSGCPSSSVALGGTAVPIKAPIALTACDITDTAGTGAPDSAPDLVVLDKGAPEQLVVFSGDGLGTFTKTATKNISAYGATGTGIFCADRNGDGKKDIYVSNAGSGSPNDNAVVCTNNGTGLANFTCTQLTAGLDNPAGIVADDLNGALPLDHCTPNNGNDSVTCSSDGIPHSVDSNPVSVTTGVFSSTLKDLAVAPNGANVVDFLYNTGAGSFGGKVPIVLGNSPGGSANKPSAVVAGDLDTNGKTDAVTANAGQSDVTVLLGTGGGGFLSPASFLAGNSPNSLGMADFDCDNKKDIAIADDSKDKVSVLTGTGTGIPSTLLNACPKGTSSCEFDAGDGPASIVVANLNVNDTKPDIAVLDINSGAITVLLNCTTGSCSCPCPPCPQCP